MDKTLQIAFKLRNTYKVNSILYSIRHLPLLKKLLPEDIYRVKGFKILANILTGIWEVVSIFLGKGIYYGLIALYTGAVCTRSAPDDAFLHLFFFFTLIGGFSNTNIFSPTRDKYYAIILMRMDANRYVLYHYAYSLICILVGSLPFAFWFGLRAGMPVWGCALLPLGVIGCKLAVAASSVWDYNRRGLAYNENKLGKWSWVAILALSAAGCLPPALGFSIPAGAVYGLMAALFLLGAAGAYPVFRFRRYREIVQQLCAQSMQQMDSVKTAGIKQQASLIDNLEATSGKKGFAYLHDLFVKRHRKILWKASKRQAAVFLGIFGAGIAAVLLLQDIRPAVREAAEELLPRLLPYMVFIMYAINRGSGFTRALFFNCDRSLLTYSFYKSPGMVVKLFSIRLAEIVKINLLPAAVMGLGIDGVLLAAGCPVGPAGYLVIFLSILAMSVFFSTHYLVLYYLMQPYNAGTEMKNASYALVCSLTYFAAFLCMQLRLPLYGFGVLATVFCLLYCGAGCLLVYRMAPRTFKLRT